MKNYYTSYMSAVYLRLSDMDEDLFSRSDKQESNSIVNQKALTLKALNSMPDVTLYDIYIDDGFTGQNFGRPAFKRMLDDIYAGKVNMIIVKDLSRFGRDHIDSGRYVRKIFPSLHVRFVSVLDHYDSLTATENETNLLIPVKNLVNDNYSRDISVKVKSHQEIMRENGLYIGSYVAYGYKKVNADKNHIEPDTYSADVVRRIFQWKLAGLSAESIADKLNRLGILSPAEYKKMVGINYKSGFQKNTKAMWSAITVIRILKNKIYIGTLEQGKRRKINYKLDKLVGKPENEWNVIENAHEAIISREDFKNVARLLQMDVRKAPDEEQLHIFAGLIHCGDCKRSMVRRKNQYGGQTYFRYICSSYNKGEGCSRHVIDERKLKDVILITLNKHLEELADMEMLIATADMAGMVIDDVLKNDRETLDKYKELEKCQDMKNSLHRDLLAEVISEEEFLQFQDIYDKRYQQIEYEITEIKRETEKILNKRARSDEWVKKFRETGEIKELDRKMTVSLIEKVFVYEDKRIEIILKYRDEYKAICKVAAKCKETMQGKAAQDGENC